MNGLDRLPGKGSAWPRRTTLVAGSTVSRVAEVVAVGEAGDVADLVQQPGHPRGTDAGQVRQGGAGLGQQLGEFLVGCLLRA
jgi:hypothetical protein